MESGQLINQQATDVPIQGKESSLNSPFLIRNSISMNDERWEQLKESLRKKFTVIDDKVEPLMVETGEGAVNQGESQVLIVETPFGKMKLVREERPAVLEKKLHYTHRQGQSAQTEYKFSETEKVYKLKIYKWNKNEYEWEELNEKNLEGLTL